MSRSVFFSSLTRCSVKGMGDDQGGGEGEDERHGGEENA